MTPYEEAIAAVSDALERAVASGRRNMNAMSLATVNANGEPSVRTVLLKAIDTGGLIFFSDPGSRKGQDLDTNPLASACLYWEPIEEQVRIDGRVERVAPEIVAEDFRARPRAGQILIWACKQSAPLESMEQLKAQVAEQEARQPSPVPVPPNWAGYRLIPYYIETWAGSRDRMHRRVAYEQRGEQWTKQLLQP